MLIKGSAGLGCRLGIESPDRDDADGGLVVSVRVVVDRLEGRSVGRLAVHEPFCASIVDLAVDVPIADSLLDIGGGEPTLAEAHLGVFGPNEALDLHGAKPTRRRAHWASGAQIAKSGHFRPPPGRSCHAGGRGFESRRSRSSYRTGAPDRSRSPSPEQNQGVCLSLGRSIRTRRSPAPSRQRCLGLRSGRPTRVSGCRQRSTRR